MRHRLCSAICIAVVALAGIMAGGSGCLGEGEGDRCTYAGYNNANPSTNGTQECQSGLVCYSGATFPPSSGTYDRCCPANPSQGKGACMTSAGFMTQPTSGADAGFDVTAADVHSADGKTEDVESADVKGGDVEKAEVAADAESSAATDATTDAEMGAVADGGADSSG